jgi:hypothetical protein
MKTPKIVMIGIPGMYDMLEEVLGEKTQYIQLKDVCTFKKEKQTFIGINRHSPTTKKPSSQFNIPIHKIGNEIFIDLKNQVLFQKKFEESMEEIKTKMFVQKTEKLQIITGENKSNF